MPAKTRYLVHVDRLDPERVADYEAARVRFAALLRKRKLSDRSGSYFKVGDRSYFAVSHFLFWRELDERDVEIEKSVAQLEADERSRYHATERAARTSPASDEIWVEDPRLAYLPSGRPLGDAVHLVIEEVAPRAEEEYVAAWREIAAVLERARYPIERRTYVSVVGSGRRMAFWLAASAAIMKTAKPIEQVLVDTLGLERGQALVARWQAAAASQAFDVTPMPAMSLP